MTAARPLRGPLVWLVVRHGGGRQVYTSAYRTASDARQAATAARRQRREARIAVVRLPEREGVSG